MAAPLPNKPPPELLVFVDAEPNRLELPLVEVFPNAKVGVDLGGSDIVVW